MTRSFHRVIVLLYVHKILPFTGTLRFAQHLLLEEKASPYGNA